MTYVINRGLGPRVPISVQALPRALRMKAWCAVDLLPLLGATLMIFNLEPEKEVFLLPLPKYSSWLTREPLEEHMDLGYSRTSPDSRYDHVLGKMRSNILQAP